MEVVDKGDGDKKGPPANDETPKNQEADLSPDQQDLVRALNARAKILRALVAAERKTARMISDLLVKID